jgi:hypothetical protein
MRFILKLLGLYTPSSLEADLDRATDAFFQAKTQFAQAKTTIGGLIKVSKERRLKAIEGLNAELAALAELETRL